MRYILAAAVIFFLCPPERACAFLPPQFFAQGLSSLWIVIATGIAAGLAPCLLLCSFLKNTLREHKKAVVFLLLLNILIAGILGVVFYFKYYKPLYKNSRLFSPQDKESRGNFTRGER